MTTEASKSPVSKTMQPVEKVLGKLISKEGRVVS
jgi:hypothetical protein